MRIATLFRFCLAIAAFSAPLAYADNNAFDLSGPPVSVRVMRGGKTLPIGEVPNLQEGDRLWIHPDLPEDQSAHYLLVVAFLRGSTNPPPDSWFTRAETWNKKVKAEGIFVYVPPDAQQVVMFLAPETGGDFSTLRSAVRGQPGTFVRASQDLNQASLDRSRLNKYLAGVRNDTDGDPKVVHDRTVLLARSLNIKLDEDCFKKPVDEQPSCLTARGDQLVLSDGHGQTVANALTNGPASDLISQLTYTTQAGAGYYSPYVGAIVDMGRILDKLHTAQYQYIPALALSRADQLDLKLNNPPSFHNPKSVIVIALPAIKGANPPPVQPVDAAQTTCLQKSPLVLQVQGAPLIFSTELAHDTVLHLQDKTGQPLDLPVTADPLHGGYVADTSKLDTSKLAENATGTIQGMWGFEPFTGPTFQLRSAEPSKWDIPATEKSSLVVGQHDTVHLSSPSAACVTDVSVRDPQGNELNTDWKAVKPDQLEVKLPLDREQAGAVTLLVKQAGLKKPDEVLLQAYDEPGHLTGFSISVGDKDGTLRGTRLAEVASLEFNGIHFAPAGPQVAGENSAADSTLPMATSDKGVAKLRADQTFPAHATLLDGRTVDVTATVGPPRPRVTLLSKNVQAEPADTTIPIKLTDSGELPQNARLAFFVKSQQPDRFPRNEKIEVASADDSLHATLSIADGSLVLQDAHSALATFDPMKSFGPSAFGPLRFRAVAEKGAAGDWQPLATLVRLPGLKSLECPPVPRQGRTQPAAPATPPAGGDANATAATTTAMPCTLTGDNLFLLEAVGADQQFTNAATVPEGFVEQSLAVPRPTNGTLYLKLRDDPAVVNLASVPVPPASQTAVTRSERPAPPPAPDSSRAQSTPAPGGDTNAPPK